MKNWIKWSSLARVKKFVMSGWLDITLDRKFQSHNYLDRSRDSVFLSCGDHNWSFSRSTTTAFLTMLSSCCRFQDEKPSSWLLLEAKPKHRYWVSCLWMQLFTSCATYLTNTCTVYFQTSMEQITLAQFMTPCLKCNWWEKNIFCKYHDKYSYHL